jgi:hypothetical protein
MSDAEVRLDEPAGGQAVENQQPITMKSLTRRKKELIEAESGGFLEFVQSRGGVLP